VRVNLATMSQRSRTAGFAVYAGLAHEVGWTLRGARHDLTAAAHPAPVSSRIAEDELMRQHILRHDGTRRHQAVFTEFVSADHCGIGTDRRTETDPGRTEQPGPGRAGIQIVGKDGGRSDEGLVLERNTLVDGHIVLDLNPITDVDVDVDEHVCSDVAVVTDDGSPAHVGAAPDPGLRTYRRAGLDLGTDVDLRSRIDTTVHLVTPYENHPDVIAIREYVQFGVNVARRYRSRGAHVSGESNVRQPA